MMLHYFRSAGTEGGEDLPSFVKFAHRAGIDMHTLRATCDKSPSFARAYEECKEILEDRIIDGALHKRYDASFAKHLLTARFGLGEKRNEAEEGGFDLEITIKEPSLPKGDDENQ